MPKIQLASLVLLVSIGCGGGDGSEGGAPVLEGAESLQGIYSIDSYLRNEAGCDAEGTDAIEVLDNETFLFGIVRTAFIETLEFSSCSSIADCRRKAPGGPGLVVNNYSVTLTEGDGMTYRGERVGSGFSGSEGCRRPSLIRHTATRVDGGVRIESRTRIGETYQPGADGFCTTELGRAAALAQPCSEHLVVRATKIEDL